ncbi:MAG: GTP 3',8-cyclase MoaA [Alphaproteobacteria bacterium]|jgi:cyclic pyranopterin phosphate synthase|nr:GTP 3',8-cyclase MoaA [Alphaproteobacteria bacterium]
MLQDNFGRTFKYLRLSLTKRCNFKCNYCLPKGYDKSNIKEELSVAEITNLAKCFASLGVEKIRLTGGEPTLRRDFFEIANNLSQINGINLALTTNGFKLKENAEKYFNAGIKNINISIDSLEPEAFKAITKTNLLPNILSGLDKCLSLSFNKVKINVVLLKNHNFNMIEKYLEFVKDSPLDIRFIELMPTVDNKDFYKAEYVSSNTLKDYLQNHGWNLSQKQTLDGPANNFYHENYQGRIGIINPYHNSFCDNCNRLRVDSYGELILCLLNFGKFSLRNYLQSPNQTEELKSAILQALNVKPEKNLLNSNKNLLSNSNFSQIGG